MKIIFLSLSTFNNKTKINFFIILSPILLYSLISKLFNYTNNFTNMIFLDFLSLMMILLSIMSTIMIILSSGSYKHIKSTILPIMMILILTFSISNMFWFYIMFETVLIPTMILITKTGNQPERLQAGIYLITYTITASLPLLICITMMKNNNSFLTQFIMMNQFKINILMLLAFLVKMPMFFTHLWLPKAHVEAPLEGSMILAAVLLKLGGYGLIRIMPMCYPNIQSIKFWIISISMLGASMTSMNCIRQKDMKALIAYSSVAHMAMTLISIFTLNTMGITGAVMMMIAHGMSSSALFLLVNDLYIKMHTRNIMLFKGLMMMSPNITFWWFIFLAINMSAPPTINTSSEVFIMSSMMAWSTSLMIPMMMASLLTASFCLSLYINISHNKNNFNYFKETTTKTFTSLFMHLIPLILLLTKMELMYM